MFWLGLHRFASITVWTYARAAAEIKLSAEATWAASEALAAKSSEAFEAMADGAQLARDGWAELTQEVQGTADVSQKASDSLLSVAAGIEAQGAAAAKLIEIDRTQRRLSSSAQDAATDTALIDQAYADLAKDYLVFWNAYLERPRNCWATAWSCSTYWPSTRAAIGICSALGLFRLLSGLFKQLFFEMEGIDFLCLQPPDGDGFRAVPASRVGH